MTLKKCIFQYYPSKIIDVLKWFWKDFYFYITKFYITKSDVFWLSKNRRFFNIRVQKKKIPLAIIKINTLEICAQAFIHSVIIFSCCLADWLLHYNYIKPLLLMCKRFLYLIFLHDEHMIRFHSFVLAEKHIFKSVFEHIFKLVFYKIPLLGVLRMFYGYTASSLFLKRDYRLKWLRHSRMWIRLCFSFHLLLALLSAEILRTIFSC